MGVCGSKDATSDDGAAPTSTPVASHPTTTPKVATPKTATAAAEGGRFREPSTVLPKAAQLSAGDGQDDTTHQVKNIFAKKLVFKSDFKPPVHHKTREEKQFILKALQNNFVFENMAPCKSDPLVMAIKKLSANEGGEIIKQGDAGDYFYILEQGRCAFKVKGIEVGQASEPGSSFGELALLYTAPCAATVTALDTPTKFYCINQTTLCFILQNQTQEGTKTKFDLLRKIPFLRDLGDKDMGQLALAMTPHPFAKNDYLMRKGDDADFFTLFKRELSKSQIFKWGTINMRMPL
ncbi:hypothetical protein ACA910_001365 [Epithemia clementina (nom. ined.)]